MLAGKRLNQRNEGFAICRVMPRFWMGAEVVYNYIDPLPNNDAFWSANLFGHFQRVHQPRNVAKAESLNSFRTSFQQPPEPPVSRACTHKSTRSAVYFSALWALAGHRPLPVRVKTGGHSEGYDGVSVKPSSIQPVTPPIIIFTGKPSRARRNAALLAPLQ